MLIFGNVKLCFTLGLWVGCFISIKLINRLISKWKSMGNIIFGKSYTRSGEEIIFQGYVGYQDILTLARLLETCFYLAKQKRSGTSLRDSFSALFY